jgi:hypothetical protein
MVFTLTCAPLSLMRSTHARCAHSGTNTVQGIPIACETHAAATPALPPEDDTNCWQPPSFNWLTPHNFSEILSYISSTNCVQWSSTSIVQAQSDADECSYDDTPVACQSDSTISSIHILNELKSYWDNQLHQSCIIIYWKLMSPSALFTVMADSPKQNFLYLLTVGVLNPTWYLQRFFYNWQNSTTVNLHKLKYYIRPQLQSNTKAKKLLFNSSLSWHYKWVLLEKPQCTYLL